VSRPWWETAVVYQIYPRSFQDSDGDGVGDLKGILRRIDYIAGLGVGAVWLSPVFVSPMADFGYDVADYCAIDPVFGTMADFEMLRDALHRRGLRLILDFVPNHTSASHPWFVESRRSRASARRDWYLWRDPAPDGGPPNNWLSLAGGPAWDFDETTGQYYLHSFLPDQPDLNWRNPAVRKAMAGVLDFWLARGVDGFRVDVIGHLLKDDLFRDDPPNPKYKPGDPPFQRNRIVHSGQRPEVIDIVREFRSVLARHGTERVLIGEIYAPVEPLVAFYGPSLDGAHLPFNFNLFWTAWTADAILDLVCRYEAALPTGAWPNWVLGNHDTSRIVTRVGAAQARIGMMLLLTLRGTPTLYNGDELGLPDATVPADRIRDPFAIRMPDTRQGRDPERAPMPWDRSPHAGFTTGEPWLPLVDRAGEQSVEAQSGDPGSMLALTRALLAIRQAEPALSEGEWAAGRAQDNVLVYERRHGGRRLLVALNMDPRPKSVGASGEPWGKLLVSTHRMTDRAAASAPMRLAGNEGVVFLTS
jgi:alpha-glucosidase